VGEGLTTHHRKNSLFRNVTRGRGFRRILWNDVGNGKWMETCKEEPLGKPRRRWEDNITTGLGEIGLERVD